MEIIQSVCKDRGRIVIAFESGWKVWLKENQMPVFPLAPGSEVDRGIFSKHILLQQYPSAIEKSVAMLASRPCSRKEIETKLRIYHYDQEVIDLVLLKLDKEKLIDDSEFAEQWFRSRIRKYGAFRILQELKHKGIDNETVKCVMENCSEEEQLEYAVNIASKKMKTVERKSDRQKAFRQLTGMLLRRGYSWEIAKKACETVLNQVTPDE